MDFLAARGGEQDILAGLELGADDYLCKPFSPREVVARAKTILRRVQPSSVPETIKAGPSSLNLSAHELNIDNRVLILTPSEYGILKVMMARPNQVFSRNQLVGLVQGYAHEGCDRTIDTHIKNLRKKWRPLRRAAKSLLLFTVPVINSILLDLPPPFIPLFRSFILSYERFVSMGLFFVLSVARMAAGEIIYPFILIRENPHEIETIYFLFIAVYSHFFRHRTGVGNGPWRYKINDSY